MLRAFEDEKNGGLFRFEESQLTLSPLLFSEKFYFLFFFFRVSNSSVLKFYTPCYFTLFVVSRNIIFSEFLFISSFVCLFFHVSVVDLVSLMIKTVIPPFTAINFFSVQFNPSLNKFTLNSLNFFLYSFKQIFK